MSAPPFQAFVHRRYPLGFPLSAPETACICRFLCFRAVLPDVPSAAEYLRSAAPALIKAKECLSAALALNP